MRPPKARRIVIAVYEGVSLLDLAGPLEAFRVASGFGGSRESRVTYECSVVSIRGGPLKTANGVELVQRFRNSNHIRRPCRACRSRCERQDRR